MSGVIGTHRPAACQWAALKSQEMGSTGLAGAAVIFSTSNIRFRRCPIMKYPTAHEVLYIGGQRKFRTLLDRCDHCGRKFTKRDLEAVAIKTGTKAADDNIVFSCSSCFSVDADPVVMIDKFLDYVVAAVVANAGRRRRA